MTCEHHSSLCSKTKWNRISFIRRGTMYLVFEARKNNSKLSHIYRVCINERCHVGPTCIKGIADFLLWLDGFGTGLKTTEQSEIFDAFSQNLKYLIRTMRKIVHGLKRSFTAFLSYIIWSLCGQSLFPLARCTLRVRSPVILVKHFLAPIFFGGLFQ